MSSISGPEYSSLSILLPLGILVYELVCIGLIRILVGERKRFGDGCFLEFLHGVVILS